MDKYIKVILNLPTAQSCRVFNIEFETFLKEVVLTGEKKIVIKQTKNMSIVYHNDYGFYIKCTEVYLPELCRKLCRVFIRKKVKMFTKAGQASCQIQGVYKEKNICRLCRQLGLLPPIKNDSDKLYSLVFDGCKIPKKSMYFGIRRKK